MTNIKIIIIRTIFLCIILLFVGCGVSTLRIHTDFIPAGSLRLGQVMYVVKRSDILTDQNKPTYEALIASGIKDSEIKDGSVVWARIFCCGGITKKYSSEVAGSLLFYVPQSLNVSLGDIVEVSSGSPPEKGDAGIINTVTRVVQKNSENYNKCWWDPKNDRLWLRVLYCDWMPREGWIKQTGSYPAWYKPAAASPSKK